MATRPDRTTGGRGAAAKSAKPVALPSAAALELLTEKLLANVERLRFLTDKRGLSLDTIRSARIGWQSGRYAVPVLDVDGTVVNVRRYKPDAAPGQKVLSLRGHGSPARWFRSPELLGAGPEAVVLVCEGELDALLAQQRFDAESLAAVAVSGTGGATSPPADVEVFRGRTVAVLYDCDEAGRQGARKLGERLLGVAESVSVVDLGLGDGEDVTDWFVTHGRSVADLVALIDSAEDFEPGGPRRSTDDLLRLAIERKVAETGSRNRACFWLACQLRDERYTESEAAVVAVQFSAAVGESPKGPFPDSEAITCVKSAYSQAARDANGSGRSGYHWDDVGNADRLADHHGRDMRYLSPLAGWHVWDGRRWTPDHDGQVARWAVDTVRRIDSEARALIKTDEETGQKLSAFASRSAAKARLNAMQEIAQTRWDSDRTLITQLASTFDVDPATLTVRNGTLVLGEVAKLREHRREDRSRLLLPVDYDPKAPAATWLGFLAQALPDEEVRQYVQRLAGYSMLGENPERRMVLLIGPSSTGKSTFVETIARVLGDYARSFNLTLLRVKQDEGPRADLVDAMPKRFLYTTEASAEWSLHADLIKRLTGNDTMTARLGHKNDFTERIPAFTPWIATNDAPSINGADKALWRRLIAVPFRSVATEEDEGLRARIVREEGAGVLRWLVDGWNDYKRHGLSEMPTAVVEETMRLREKLSPVDAWLTDVADRDPAGEARFEELWGSWSEWQEDSGLRPHERLTKMQLASALDGRGFPTYKRRAPGEGDRKVNFRRGLRLREVEPSRVKFAGGGPS
jgi:P4 family phage/plasmid primase-like protien